MESQAGMQADKELLEQGTPVKTIEEDEDNTFIARLKSELNLTVKKRFDKNHTIKDIVSKLYDLQKEDMKNNLINEAANLSPGEFTMAISAVRDQKMEKKERKENSKEYKVNRIQKKRNRNTNERKHLVREGKTYGSQMEFDQQQDPELTTEIPLPFNLDGTECKVFFDLETTGLGRNSDIIQIAAKSYSNSFNRYVIPRVDIQIEASKITGITYSHGTNKMYVRGQIVEPVSLHKALLDFIHF
ncbi:unnamed protein product [Mytilus edulis]|uniref:Exonuclease domain-containing protein n=1 Tax=Mytilus edulis TaxID=6550 RepID=A0A8S3QGU3_MYTED|nr:unnamed protein product [Mytilus edulis]